LKKRRFIGWQSDRNGIFSSLGLPHISQNLRKKQALARPRDRRALSNSIRDKALNRGFFYLW